MTQFIGGCRLQCMASYLRVKICGVTEEADAVQAAELGADWIGLNFYKGSPRYIMPAKAETIVHDLPPSVEPVGIFVFPESPPNSEVIRKLRLRTIQLHWEVEPPVPRLAYPFGWSGRQFPGRRLRVSLIQAFSVGEENDLLKIKRYFKECRRRTDLPDSDGPSLAAWLKKPRPEPDYPAAILVDARVPGQFGGTGKTAPWGLLADFRSDVSLILAGGLTPENVAEAVRIVRPSGVDVASGVEKSPGKKDPEKMKRFIQIAREAAEK